MPGAPGARHRQPAVGDSAVHLPDLRVMAARADARKPATPFGRLGCMAVVVAQVPVKLVCEVEPAVGFGAASGIEQLLRCELPRTHHGPGNSPAQRTEGKLTPWSSVLPSAQTNCVG